ncbi:MAG: MraY family glycosyltransferase [SAR324 cluster bacterium]|nr:MraY family glycosyltransferase [SAR324 cluster bacterium]
MTPQMQINFWKYLFGAGVFGLILCSILIMITLYLVNSKVQQQRKLSLRDQNIEPVSRFGGIGLYWGFLGVLLLLWWIPVEKQLIGLEYLPQNRLAGMCIGGLLAWGLGFVDDVIDLRARWKLTGQIILSVLAIGLGFEINTIQVPVLQIINLGPWSWPITILWIVGVINAINLIDGLDGLASGLVIIALACFGILCLWQGQYSLLILIFVLVGVTLGFWLFNRPQASIFMGDSGSMFLGYVMALLSIWVTDLPGRGPSALPLLILAVPILDTGFALFRRFFKGIPFYSADKDHLHHRLIARGFSATQAMLALVGFSTLFGVIALMAYRITNFLGFSFLLGLSLAYILLYWLGYEVIRSPLSSIKEQTDHRKRRNLLLSLSEQIEEFFAKDPDSESVFRSFHFWTKLAGVSRFEVRINNKIVSQSGTEDPLHRILSFRQGSCAMLLALDESSLITDSDFKGNLLESGSMALMRRLEQLELN